MRTFGVKNGPVDRRRLSDQDKNDYNSSGAYGERALAVARTRAYRGNMAYQANTPVASTEQTPGSGGLGVGLGAQVQRNREIGANNAKTEAFKPKMKDIKSDLYKN